MMPKRSLLTACPVNDRLLSDQRSAAVSLAMHRLSLSVAKAAVRKTRNRPLRSLQCLGSFERTLSSHPGSLIV